MNTQPPKKSHKRDYRVAAIVAVTVLAAGYGIAHVIGGDTTPRKRVMDTVALKLITPPPPPPKQEPPPPPPKLVEKQKIDPPIDKPEAPKPMDAPPPGPLALDAKGGAGNDAFGLGGKPGGADFTGGGGTRFGHYAILAQAQITRRLREDEKLSSAKYHGTLKIWFSAAGAVARVELLHGTGDADLDERIRQAIASMPSLPEAPPSDMPAMLVRVGARSGSET
jgi:periplasmic protein TonB